MQSRTSKHFDRVVSQIVKRALTGENDHREGSNEYDTDVIQAQAWAAISPKIYDPPEGSWCDPPPPPRKSMDFNVKSSLELQPILGNVKK